MHFMVLTEDNIRQMVKESVELLMELSVTGILGRSGPIKVSDLFVPSERFATEYALSSKIYEKNRKNPRYRVDIEKTFGDTDAYKIYQNYYNAMMSKEGKKALNFMTWLHSVCHGRNGYPIYGYENGGNCLFGMWIDNFFLARYFAPANPYGMWRLVEGLAQYNNIIFAVTQDMSPMLERVGMPKADKTHEAPYRGNVAVKDVFGTSQEAIEKGLQVLDGAMEIQKNKKDIKKLMSTDDNELKTLINKFNTMSPSEKRAVKQKVLAFLNAQHPELLKQYGKYANRNNDSQKESSDYKEQ